MLILAMLACALYALTWWSTGWGFSPDGFQYERMTAREPAPIPYARRIGVPWLLSLPVWNRWTIRQRWNAWGAAWTILSAVLTGMYVGGSLARQACALLLFVGLPGIWRLNVRLPVLIDPTAYSLAVLGAILLKAGYLIPGLLVVGLGASVKETVPLFAAAFALQPLALLGLAVPVVIQRRARLVQALEPYLTNPMREARKVHDFFDWQSKLLPWGALIFLAPLSFTWNSVGISALLALALGYSQLMVAQDNARLYQWAAPAVIAVALQSPPWWVYIAVVLGLFNPYRGV